MEIFFKATTFKDWSRKKKENMNRQITSNKIETVIWKKQSKQKVRTRWFQRQILSNIHRVNSAASETLPNNCKGRNTSKFIVQGHYHPDTKTRQRDHTEKTKFRQISGMNIRTKNLNKILADRIQCHIKKIIYPEKEGFILGMQGFFNICKSIDVIPTLTNWRITKTNHLRRYIKNSWQNSTSIYDKKKI